MGSLFSSRDAGTGLATPTYVPGMVLMSAVEFFTQVLGSPFLTISGKMTKGDAVGPRQEVTLLPAAWAVRCDLDRTVERRALLLVCTGVNTGMGGVLRWLGSGSFCLLDLAERSRGSSLHSGGEAISRSSCGGDLRGEKVTEVASVCCSAPPGILVGCDGAELTLGAGSKGCGVESTLADVVVSDVSAKGPGTPSGAGWVLVLPDGDTQGSLFTSSETSLESEASGRATENAYG